MVSRMIFREGQPPLVGDTLLTARQEQGKVPRQSDSLFLPSTSFWTAIFCLVYSCRRTTANHDLGPPSEKLKSLRFGTTSKRDGLMDWSAIPQRKQGAVLLAKY